jgi:hydrogenase expression/formation protein HypD
MPNDFSNAELGRKLLLKVINLAQQVTNKLGRSLIFMEVCGTHTVAISKSGIRSILASHMELRSGPGCPVCVTDQCDIDTIIELSKNPDITMATFGDMVRVPGTYSSLEKERAFGASIEICYSPHDALALALKNPSRDIVFLGVGFETTTPAIALTIAAATSQNLQNFSVFSVHKTIPPAMHALLNDQDLHIDGFILPGHVCTVTGRRIFDFISSEYHVPAVIAGFESIDIIQAIYLLLKQISSGNSRTEIGYTRLVHEEGNAKAHDVVTEFFDPVDAPWRGFGSIPGSGLALKTRYDEYDAVRRFPVKTPKSLTHEGCSCGEVLRGKFKPRDCPLFGEACTPSTPIGPCMVSTEGACAANYLYELDS